MNKPNETPKNRKGWQSFNRSIFAKKSETESVEVQLDKAEVMRGKSQRMGRRLMDAPGQ